MIKTSRELETFVLNEGRCDDNGDIILYNTKLSYEKMFVAITVVLYTLT